MKEKRKDIHSAIVMVLFGLFIFVGSFWIPVTTSDILGSRFFPRVVAVMMWILSAFQIMNASAYIKHLKASGAVEERAVREPVNMRFVLTTVILFAYYVMILGIGFTLTSIIYLFAAGIVLMTKAERQNKRSVVILAISSVIIPIFINYIFWNVFSIKLPAGALFY